MLFFRIMGLLGNRSRERKAALPSSGIRPGGGGMNYMPNDDDSVIPPWASEQGKEDKRYAAGFYFMTRSSRALLLFLLPLL